MMDLPQQTTQTLRQVADVGAYGITVAALMQWLPAIAALFSILWLSMQMIEKAVGKPFHIILKDLWAKYKRK